MKFLDEDGDGKRINKELLLFLSQKNHNTIVNESVQELYSSRLKREREKERERDAWASLVGARGSHWPIESVSLMAAIENWGNKEERELIPRKP
jgi:hypothetical protein